MTNERMIHSTTFRTHLLILLSLLFLAVPITFAQERVAREAFYNSSDGFHIFIPAAWENESTEASAHFSRADIGVDIYAASAPTANVQAGIEQVIHLFLPDFAGEPITSEVILSNGTWTQNIYLSEDVGRLTVYGQEYDGATYVVVWHSEQSAAQPIIVPGEDVQTGIAAALETLGLELDEPVTSEAFTINEQVWTRNTYDSAASVTVLGRVRGENTLVLVIPAESAGAETTLPVFFTLLTDFFITPATTPYLYLGLAAAAIIAFLFIGSIAIRSRNLRKDMETLETLEAEG